MPRIETYVSSQRQEVPTGRENRCPGNVIGFNFSFGIPPGFSTRSLEIQTNATNFAAGTLQIIDGSVASVSVFAPTAVPLPASVWLMLSGLIGVGAMARKRRAA